MGASSPAPRDALVDQPPWAAELLAVVGLLGPEPSPVWLIEEHRDPLGEELAAILADPEKRAQRVGELEREKLLEVVDEKWSLPTDLRDAHLESLPESEVKDRCLQALEILRSAFPEEPEEHEHWPRCEELLPHLIAATDRAEERGLKSASGAWLLDRAAAYLHSKGEFAKALELSTRALAAADLADEDPLLATIRHTHGCLLSEHGEINEARAELERALEVHLSAGKDLSAREDRVSLAEVLSEAGEPEEAMEQIDLALADRDPEQADSCDCAAYRTRAWIFWGQKELERAEAAYEEAVELTERVQGPRHQDTVNGLTGLGGVRGARGRLEEARADLERALEVLEGTVDEQHPEIAVVRSNLSGVLHSLGELEGAREQLEKSLEAGEELLPSDHKGLWIRHNKLASVLRSLNQYEAALAHAEAALEISERTAEIADVKVEADLQTLAPILKELGELSKARSAYGRAREIAARERGEDHRDVAAYDFHLGRLSRELGDLAASRGHLAHALRVYREIPEPSFALAVRLELAALLAELGDQLAETSGLLGQAEEAREVRGRAGAAFREAIEEELRQAEGETLTVIAEAAIARAPDLTVRALEKAVEGEATDPAADSLLRGKVGLAWHRLGRSRLADDPEAAAEAFKIALPFFEGNLMFQGVILHDLATASLQGNVEEAIRLFREAADRKRQAAEKGKRRDLALTLYALGHTLAGSNRLTEAVEAFEEQVEVLRTLPEPDVELEARALHAMGEAARKQGEFDRAIELYQSALERKRNIRKSIQPSSLGVTLVWLGRTLTTTGRYDEATACFQEWLETLRDLPREDPQAEGVVLHDLANVSLARGERVGAIDLLREAAERKREGEDRRDLALTLRALGQSLAGEDPDGALATFQETLQALRSLEKPDPGFEGVVLHDIGDMHRSRRELEKAAEFYREAVVSKQRQLRDNADLLNLVASQQALGRTLLAARRLEDSVAAFQDQLRTLRRLSQADPQGEGVALHDLAEVRVDSGDTEEAISLYQQALARKQEAEEVNKASIATTEQALGRALEREKHFKPALEAYEESLRLIRELPELDAEFEATILHDLADVRRELGEAEAAAELYSDSAEASARLGDPMGQALSLQGLGLTLEKERQYPGALEAYRKAYELMGSLPDHDLGAEGSLLRDLGDVHLALGEAKEAVDRYGEAVRCLEEAGAASADLAAALMLQASAEFAHERNDGSVSVLERALELIRSEPDPDPNLLYGALSKLGTAMEEEDPRSAIAYLTEAGEILDQHKPSEYLERAAVETLLFRAYEATDEKEKATAAQAAAVSIFERGVAAGLRLDSDSLATFHRFAVDKSNFELADAVLQAVRDRASEEKSMARVGRTLALLLGTEGRRLEKEEDLDGALAAYAERLDVMARLPGDDPQLEGVALHDLANMHLLQGRAREAIELYEAALAKKRQAGDVVPKTDLAITHLALASTQLQEDKPSEATAGGGEALDLLRSLDEPPSHLLASALALAACAAEGEDDVEARIEMLQEAEQLMGDPPDLYRLEPHWLVEQIARLYEQVGKAEQAEAARSRAAALKD